MKTHKIFILITAILESILGIPFLGAMIIVNLGWSPLLLMLVLHISTLLFCIEAGEERKPSTLGIVTSMLGLVPLVGYILHVVTSIYLWKIFLKPAKK